MSDPPENTLNDLIKTLVAVIEKKDPYMKGHAERVATNCVRFAKNLDIPQAEIKQIYLAGLLHDVGVVYLPLEITQKKGKLTDEEMEMVKKHPLVSEKIISKHDMLRPLLPIIRHHHEFVDGSGYPDGLKGDAIPMGARILAIVGDYDVITSTRPHRPALSMEDALVKIEKAAGQKYDRDLAAHFITFLNASDKTASEEVEEETISGEKEGKTEEAVAAIEEVKKEEETISAGEEGKGGEEEEINGEEEPGTVGDVIKKVIQRFKRGDLDLPVLPKVVQDIQMEMSKPNVTVDKVSMIIERDAVISVRLVSVANSPVYRGTEKVQTVKQAIPRLGIKETQSIIGTIANKNLYNSKDEYFSELMENLWLHSLASAYGARLIAEKLVPGDTEKFFFMGIIHDIGKVLILKAFDEAISQDQLFNIEEVVVSIQEVHTSFGRAILKQWGFSEEFSRIAFLHEGPEFRPETDKDILSVNLAGNIASSIGYWVVEGEKFDLLNLDSARLLEFDSDTIDRLAEKMKELMQNSSKIF